MIRRDEWFYYPASQQMEQLQIHCELLQENSNTICQKRNQKASPTGRDVPQEFLVNWGARHVCVPLTEVHDLSGVTQTESRFESEIWD